MQITNLTKGIRLLNAKVAGNVTQVSLASGETKDIDVIETTAFKARVKAGEFAVKGSASKPKPDTGMKAEHHGGGKFNVTHGETLLLSGLSKADADAFNSMSDADKETYVQAENARG